MKLPIANCQRRRKTGQGTTQVDKHPALQFHRRERASAFTLLEVIVASAIFFMVAFAIMEMVMTSLAAARAIQQRSPDAGILAASLTLTNQLVEGADSGDFEDLYPGLYPGYSWTREVNEVGSNSLFQVDFTIYATSAKKRGASDIRMSILLFRPGSKPGSATKGRL